MKGLINNGNLISLLQPIPSEKTVYFHFMKYFFKVLFPFGHRQLPRAFNFSENKLTSFNKKNQSLVEGTGTDNCKKTKCYSKLRDVPA